MSRTRFDFREATYFLNDCVPLDELYHDVRAAMHLTGSRRLSKAQKDEIWHTLLCCADFLETITTKVKGGRDDVA